MSNYLKQLGYSDDEINSGFAQAEFDYENDDGVSSSYCAAMFDDEDDDVVVGSTDGMTDEEMGECWIDDEDVERAREILRDVAINKMVAEQKQEMDDEYIGLTPGIDREKVLNDVIDIQERMATGMLIINDEAAFKDALYAVYAPLRDRFTNAKACLNEWKCKHGTVQTFPWWKQWKEARYNRDIAWTNFSSQRDEVSKLWNHWFTLKEECQELASSTSGIWDEYFALVNNPLDPRNIFGDPEEFDDQVHLVVGVRTAPREIGNGLVLLNEMVSVTPQRRLDGELEAHLAEMAEYDRPLNGYEKDIRPYPWFMNGSCEDLTSKLKNRLEIDRDNERRAAEILEVMKADEVRYKISNKPNLFIRVLNDMWDRRPGRVSVSGYTRRDGTMVTSYTRLYPLRRGIVSVAIPVVE